MTKQQAYEILNRTLSQIQTTREGHHTLADALNTLLRIEAPADPKNLSDMKKKENTAAAPKAQ